MKYKYNGQWYDVSIKALDGMPIGSIILYAGTDIPTGWLICDGTSLSEEEYPELFDKIEYIYGGSGTSFNLPNFKGRVGVGLDSTQSYCDNLGETGGSPDLQRHNHFMNKSAGSGTESSWGFPAEYNTNMGDLYTNEAGTGDSGNLQPYIVVNYIIKATNTTPTMASIVNTTNNSTEDAYSCNYINNSNTYSTDEVNTGKTWIDGKPIYRKTLYLEASTATQNISITSVANNISQIWIDVSSSNYSQGGIVSDWETSGRYRITIDSGAIYYVCSNNSYKDGYITFNYTKTTD